MITQDKLAIKWWAILQIQDAGKKEIGNYIN